MTFTHRNDLGNEVTGPHIFQDGNGGRGTRLSPSTRLLFFKLQPRSSPGLTTHSGDVSV